MIRAVFLFFTLMLAITLVAQKDTIIKKDASIFDNPFSNQIDARLIEKNIEIAPEEELNTNISYLFYNKSKKSKLSYTINPKKYLDPKKETKHNFLLGAKPMDSDVLVVKHFDGKNISKTKLKTAQNLGTIESNTKFVRIEYRDFGLVDGDRVKIFLNEKEIESNVKLDGLFYTIHIDLKDKGYNRIDIQAINQGMYGPNTAQFIVYDDKGNVLSHKAWNLQKGSVATLGIVRH